MCKESFVISSVFYRILKITKAKTEYNMPILSPLLTVKQACAYLQICRAHFYSLLKSDPNFPKPIRLGQTVRFKAADFGRYVDVKVAGEGKVDSVGHDLAKKRGRGRPPKAKCHPG